LGAERQWHDSEVNPFDASRFFGRYTGRVSDDATVNANTTYTILDYDEPERRVELFAALAGIEYRLGRYLILRGDVRWRDERDDIAGRTTGFEQELELDWRYRQTQLYTRARNSRLDSHDRQEEFQFFEFGIRREF